MAPWPSQARRLSLWHATFAALFVLVFLYALSHLHQSSGAALPFFSGLGVSAPLGAIDDLSPHHVEPGQVTPEHGPHLDNSIGVETETVTGTGLSVPADKLTGDYTVSSEDGFDAQNGTPASSMIEYGLFGGYLVKLPRRELVSRSTKSGNYTSIFFNGINAYNPNLIPHPAKRDWYIIVAQKGASHGEQEELVCEATFVDGALACSKRPTILPTTDSITGQCSEQYSALNQFPGPRDARLAYSPRAPYLVYGSQSHYACLGIWAQDLRTMVSMFNIASPPERVWYQQATELWRPEPYDALQKNFFMFWDSQNDTYVQTDTSPKRVLAKLDSRGHVVQDFTSMAEAHDEECMIKYMPVAKVSGKSIAHQHIHQTSNSLAITLCKREDPGCVPDEHNTFIMHIIHHKITYSLHPVYEPYLVLFKNEAPFKLHAIAQKAFWIRGRAPPQPEKRLAGNTTHYIPGGQSEMFYVTSMSWKASGQNYHGYLDDTLFLAFGIEDSLAGVIDVFASDLLQDLAFCGQKPAA